MTTQISFWGRIATTCAAGGAITTSNVQILPDGSPPIGYIGSTTPWKVLMTIPTTTYGEHGVVQKRARVLAYGRNVKLHSNAWCVALDMSFESKTKAPHMTVTYQALGEIVRP